MKAIITTKAGWSSLKNSSILPDLSYDDLLKVSTLKDMRKSAQPDKDDSIMKDYTDVCKKSLIPFPGFVDSGDDTSSESYTPHSDWRGPSGNSWIGK